MSFPTITFKFNGHEDAKPLSDVVEQKFSALGRLIDGVESAQCEVEFKKQTAQHSGQIFRVEANLTVRGDLFRAEATEASFEAAIDEVRNELDKELSRAKDKHITLDKAAGREMKEMLQAD